MNPHASSVWSLRTLEELAARFRFDAARLAALRRELAERGSVFVAYDADTRDSAAAGDRYGSTFVMPEHLAARWTDERWTIVEHAQGGLRGWQDVVVLERRAR